MAGFGFAAPDYLTRAQAGLPVGASDPAVAAQAPPATLPAQAAQGAPGSPYKPSLWDVAQGVIFDGQSPAEAAMAARGREYQQRQMAMVAQALQNAPPAQRLAMLLNPAKFGEEWAKNFAPHDTAEGATTRGYGGGEAGGFTSTAPKMVFDDKRGVYATQTPTAYTRTGLNDGDYSLSPTGAEISGRTGLTGRAVSLPQIVAPGSVPNTFTPSVNADVGLVSGLPAIPAPTGGKATATANTGVPRGIRNLNFGNLRPLADGRPWTGQTGVDPDGYAIFATPEDGANAARTNLQSYARQGINTPLAIAQRWAPAGDGKNDPKAYAGYLAGKLGVHPNDPVNMADPAVQQTLLRGIFDFENGPSAMAGARFKGASRQAAVSSSSGSAPGFSGPPAKTPQTLSPQEAIAHGYAPGSVVERAADGTTSVKQQPQYDAQWDRGQRDSFAGWEPVKQYTAVVKPSYDALIKNIGQMSGPAAYAILDTTIRTDNPGATTRQAQLDSFEHKFGLEGSIVGKLLNYQGKGSIPKDIQQKIVNSMVPFAQAHYDAANSLYQAQAQMAQAHGRKPEDVTIPLGERPEGMSLTVPPAQQRKPGMYSTPKGTMKWTGTGWLPVN